jgi:hypothetical protein
VIPCGDTGWRSPPQALLTTPDNPAWPVYSTASDASLTINLTQSSAAWLTSYPSCALINQEAPQSYAALSGAFTTSCTGDVYTSALLPTGSALGDPSFTSFRGVRYQVHGLDGGVHSVLSDPAALINARLTFLESGVCPPAHIQTACFSHPGSYLGQLAIRTRHGDRLLLQPDAAAVGFARFDLSVNGTLVPVEASTAAAAVSSEAASILVTVLDAWRVSIAVGNYELRVDSSDGFVNIAALRVLDWPKLTRERPHGPLGQT